jgi:tetratricopeptide (TPR) repeat protein
MSDLAEIVQAVPGRESEVVALLERAFALREKSVAEDPAAPESVAKVAGSCVKLADALARQKMRARSEELYRRAILKYARLMDVDSKASAYRLDYGRALRNLADQLRVAGRPDESRRLARESIKQLRDVYASDLRETAHRAAYSLACRTLCAIEIDRKDRRGADQAVREYLEVEPLGFEDALESARLLCRCAQLGREDHALSPAEREDVVRAYTDRAMKALRTAVNDGFRGAEELDASLGYEPLRGREDFRRLICDIKERLEAVRESS